MKNLYKTISLFSLSLVVLSIVSINIENRSKCYNGKEFVLDDVAFRLLPKIKGCTFIAENTIPFILILLLLYYKSINCEFIVLFTIIIILRTISIGLTILPKTNPKCCMENSLRIGVCHYKMFSGHTAFTTLAMLTLALKNSNLKPLVPIVIIAQGVLMLIARAHYSVDVFIGFLVTLLVFTNKTYIMKNTFV